MALSINNIILIFTKCVYLWSTTRDFCHTSRYRSKTQIQKLSYTVNPSSLETEILLLGTKRLDNTF